MSAHPVFAHSLQGLQGCGLTPARLQALRRKAVAGVAGVAGVSRGRVRVRLTPDECPYIHPRYAHVYTPLQPLQPLQEIVVVRVSALQGCTPTPATPATTGKNPMKPGSLRETMPDTAAFIDEMREVFGAAEINASIRAGLDGQPTFWACENDVEIGTRDTRTGIPLSDIVIEAPGATAGPARGRKGGAAC
jgi:hypothetical protein